MRFDVSLYLSRPLSIKFNKIKSIGIFFGTDEAHNTATIKVQEWPLSYQIGHPYAQEQSIQDWPEAKRQDQGSSQEPECHPLQRGAGQAKENKLDKGPAEISSDQGKDLPEDFQTIPQNSAGSPDPAEVSEGRLKVRVCPGGH